MPVLFLLLAVSSARAEDDIEKDDDHRASDEAYMGQKSGNILSLLEIRKRAGSFIKGEIIETKFISNNGHPAYEIYFLDSKGRRKEIYLDARTGAIADVGEDE